MSDTIPRHEAAESLAGQYYHTLIGYGKQALTLNPHVSLANVTRPGGTVRWRRGTSLYGLEIYAAKFEADACFPDNDINFTPAERAAGIWTLAAMVEDQDERFGTYNQRAVPTSLSFAAYTPATQTWHTLRRTAAPPDAPWHERLQVGSLTDIEKSTICRIGSEVLMLRQVVLALGEHPDTYQYFSHILMERAAASDNPEDSARMATVLDIAGPDPLGMSVGASALYAIGMHNVGPRLFRRFTENINWYPDPTAPGLTRSSFCPPFEHDTISSAAGNLPAASLTELCNLTLRRAA